MRPGILIQHAREPSRPNDQVRADVTGFIGCIPKARWPQGANHGDFIDQELASWPEFLVAPVAKLVDPVTARCVHAFFRNGGDRCHVLGMCLTSERDLMQDNPFDLTFHSLLDHLRGEENLGLLTMPVLAYLPVEIDRLGRPTVAAEPTMRMLLDHCREMNNRFLLLDTPQDLHDEPLVRWVGGLRDRASVSGAYGALYYPWLMNGDDLFPPSGAVAGLYARVEIENAPFGVKWPPANQVLRGVTHPAVPVRWRESDRLVDAHINPILAQPSRGVVVWGARTLSRDPTWTHVNTRRIASVVAEQLRRDAEWVVFEQQRPELWEIVSRMVRSRLDRMWGAGLLTGDKAGLEYEVQCDEELNPPEVRDAGQVHVRVMIRPISTAESIVVELRLGT
ncbi:MAG: phage tail sheath subtilisin-like domain-containing protein [Myxococcota bacterium]